MGIGLAPLMACHVGNYDPIEDTYKGQRYEQFDNKIIII